MNRDIKDKLPVPKKKDLGIVGIIRNDAFGTRGLNSLLSSH